jgi:hypothetical protein
MTSQEGVTAKENVENHSRDVYFSVEGRDVARNDHDRAVRLAGIDFIINIFLKESVLLSFSLITLYSLDKEYRRKTCL